MKYSKYILNSVKDRFGVEEEDTSFQDLNYAVGNTSGLDVAPNVPSPMDQRIGQLAQRGGGVQELIISNPATYQIDKQEMLDVIQQLDIDISIHSDPSTGFASAYRTRGQQAVGFETAHDYFTRYLEQFAVFKREAENREEYDFDITRINPHIATSTIPPLSERMAHDVGVDPFGHELSELVVRDSGEKVLPKIFKNSEFMKRFYRTFILHEVDDPYQIYRLLERFSPEFRKKWREAQKEACDKYWNNITDFTKEDDRIMGKIGLIQSARMADQGLETAWLDVINEEVELEDPIKGITIDQEMGENGLEMEETEFEIKTIGDLTKIRINLERLNLLSQAYYNLDDSLREQETELETPIDRSLGLISTALEEALNLLWEGNGEQFRISVDAKINALTSHLDIQQTQIWETAQDDEGLEDAAVEVMGRNLEMFEEEADIGKDAREKYWDLVDGLVNNFERAIWMESNIFYYIMPAWMKTSNEPESDELSFDAPKFIWETIVERKHGEIDLMDPENGYFEKLIEDNEFRMDVAAAVGCLYTWGHFTQKKGEFDISGERYVDDNEGRYTWIEWMNEYGIGVNLETMVGDANQIMKVWRPKDIVVAGHAINMTAQKELGEIHEDLYGRPVKFTIDLEHTASFGVDPWKEMERLIKQEEELAEGINGYDLGIDKNKPLAPMLRSWHMIKPGLETQQSESRHGPWDRGDVQMYEWLYEMVDAGFARSEEVAYLMYEVGGEQKETMYMARIAMNMIELGIKPEELDPNRVDPGGDYEDEREALIARFFGMDRPNFDREWAKIEEHAFDPLDGLLEAESWDYTFSSQAAIQNDNRPNEWKQEEYK